MLTRFAKLPAALLAAGGLLSGASAQAAVSIDSGSYTYSQNFDSLAASGTANAWTNDSTLAGWFLYNKDLAAITSYRADTGTSTTGSFYSYGLTSADRALGGLASGSTYFGNPAPASGALAGWIAVAFQNNTGAALDSFTVNFDGEQWRNGGNTNASYQAQSMVLQYGFGASFASVTNWTAAGSNFNWSAPVTTVGSAAAVNGNTAGLVSHVGGTVATNWQSGDTLWVRWVENNDAGNDHGLAIDNFALSVTAVPEPQSVMLMFAGLFMLGAVVRRRTK